jgi:hypothetical protein
MVGLETRRGDRHRGVAEIDRAEVLVLHVIRRPVIKAAPALRRDESRILLSVEMPLSDVAGPIARLLQRGGHRRLCERQQRMVARHTGCVRKFAGEHRRRDGQQTG